MINRRQFIKRVVIGYGSLLLLPGCVRGTQKGVYRVLTNEEADCLGCICEQFIPADQYVGAREAGVVNYIDKVLYRYFPELKETYQKGIYSLEAYCKDTYGKFFAQLDWNTQYTLMVKMEKAELPESFWERVLQKDFFNMALRHTMQGYYGPPRHGGNKDYVSYRMMRLDFPLLAGQNRYEK
ncbi:MAG: gluconate 2-dehydrogenase subunit 3 family protein [Tannerella sp.]|nr:gluconate 2-dehydrogenase subunit 3 family protein [Tannerella sp.]